MNYMWTWLVCGVITVVLQHADANEVLGGPTTNCGQGWSPQLRIYAGHHFQKPGRLIKWGFYAMVPGTFFAGIWRPFPSISDGNDPFNLKRVKRWKLISKTEITVETTGVQEYWVPFTEEIVQPGDSISVHYPRGTAWNSTIVSECTGLGDVHAKINVPLVSTVRVAGIRDDALRVGYSVKSTLDKQNYFTALIAYTVNQDNNIRFAPDTHHFWSTGEGRIGEAGVIEVKPNNHWGTICETRASDPNIPKSWRVAMVAEFWGNKICKMLNPEYVMIDSSTRSLELKDDQVWWNVECPDEGGLSSCVSDTDSLAEKSCKRSQHQNIACMPNPDKYAIQVSAHMSE